MNEELKDIVKVVVGTIVVYTTAVFIILGSSYNSRGL
jgi:hypothetical protein